MKSNQMVAACGLILCVGLLALAGCGNRPDARALAKAFENGSPAAKKIVTHIVAQVDAGKTMNLSDQARELWRLPGITQEQRDAVMAFVEQLAAYNDWLIAATNGGSLAITNPAGKRALTNRPPAAAAAAARATNAGSATNAPAATNPPSAK